MISCFLPKLQVGYDVCFTGVICKIIMASCRNCPCDSASCRDSRQEAKSHGQSLQEAIYRAQQSRREARDGGQSRWKSNMTDSLCRKRKLAGSFIPCGQSFKSSNDPHAK